MRTKAMKATKNNLKRVTDKLSALGNKTEDNDFLPLEGGPACKLPEQKLPDNSATVLYVGRIPHGFYEKEMRGYFGQFGTIKRLRIARNKRVAKIVADTMHNYLLFEHLLQVYLIPLEHVRLKLKDDQKRRKRIEAAGIEYECPEIVGNIHPTPKKIKFED